MVCAAAILTTVQTVSESAVFLILLALDVLFVAAVGAIFFVWGRQAVRDLTR